MLSILPLFLIVYLSDLFKHKEKILISTIIFSIIAIIVFIYDEVFTRFFIAVKNQIFVNGNIVIFSKEHQAHYVSSIKMFLDQPFLE